MIQTLWIPGQLPSLNDIIAAAKGNNGRGILYQKMKQELTSMIALRARVNRIKPVASAHFKFHWCEAKRHRDPDNVAVSKKFVFDGLVTAGVLENDGWDQILGWADTFEVTGKPGVVVTIDG